MFVKPLIMIKLDINTQKYNDYVNNTKMSPDNKIFKKDCNALSFSSSVFFL